MMEINGYYMRIGHFTWGSSGMGVHGMTAVDAVAVRNHVRTIQLLNEQRTITSRMRTGDRSHFRQLYSSIQVFIQVNKIVMKEGCLWEKSWLSCEMWGRRREFYYRHPSLRNFLILFIEVFIWRTSIILFFLIFESFLKYSWMILSDDAWMKRILMSEWWDVAACIICVHLCPPAR